MIEIPEGFDSIFRYITVVAQRSEQLINGAKLRTDTRHPKPTLQAKDEVNNGHVSWRILTQEELDAQRQAMVDKFRAEVGAEMPQPVARPPLHDVLPTFAEETDRAARQLEASERDEDLTRLQRLLGMAQDEVSEDEERTEEADLVGNIGIEVEDVSELEEGETEELEEGAEELDDEEFSLDLEDEPSESEGAEPEE